MWRRFGAALARFPTGLYLADLSLGVDARGPFARFWRRALGAFVRGAVYVDFADEPAALRELEAAGFEATLHRPVDFASLVGAVEEAGARRVRIVDARTARL